MTIPQINLAPKSDQKLFNKHQISQKHNTILLKMF